MKNILFLVFFCIAHFCFAQQDSIRPHLILKANPLALLNPAFPSISFGLEGRVLKHLGIQVEYGHPISQSNPFKFKRPLNLNYRIFRAEVREYVSQKKDFELYLGFESFCIAQKYQDMNQYYWKGNEVWRYDTATINMQNWAWVAKSGLQGYLGKKWVLDAYVGLGIRKKYAQIKNVTVDWKPSLSNIYPQVYKISGYASIGLKVGYIIF